jgi:hypothetical protein
VLLLASRTFAAKAAKHAVYQHGHVGARIGNEDHQVAKIDAEASHSPNSARGQSEPQKSIRSSVAAPSELEQVQSHHAFLASNRRSVRKRSLSWTMGMQLIRDSGTSEFKHRYRNNID